MRSIIKLIGADQFAVYLFDLVQHGLETSLFELAFSVVHTSSLDDVNAVTFGRTAPDCLFAHLGKEGLFFHVPRPQRESEVRLEIVKNFISSLAQVVLRSRSVR